MSAFFASDEWQVLLDNLPNLPFATWESFYATVFSTLLALAVGLPVGVLLVAGEKDGVRPLPSWLMTLLNLVINLLRSVPFLILMIMVLPLSRLVLGTSIGTVASIIPLFMASFPFVSRLVETSLREVDGGVVEAAQSMGATPLQIILKVMIPESLPSLIANVTIALTTILGYSATATNTSSWSSPPRCSSSWCRCSRPSAPGSPPNATNACGSDVCQGQEQKKKAGPALLRIQKGGACRLRCHRRLSSFKISLKSPESTRRAPSA